MKSKEKKRLKNWQWFNTFMMETHFHGFNMAANAKSRCELFTWLSMILLCFLLTVCQTISLVNLYKSEPTMSVTTVNHEGTFTCGNSQVCFTWDLDQEGLLEDSKSVDSLLAEFTHEQLQQLKNGNVSSSTFHPSLLRLTIAMLNDITRYEGNAMGYQKKMLEATWGYHNNKIHETKNYALHQIHQFFVNREVSMKLLMSSVVSITCQVAQSVAAMFTFRLKTGGFRRYDLNICNVTNFVYMTELGFCVNLDSTKEIVTFRNSFDMLVITSEPPQLDSFLNQSKAENAKGLVLVDILGTKFSKLQGYVFSSSYLKHAVTTIDIHGHYKSYNSRKRPCYPYKNGAVACRDYCFGKLIANHCKCWPVHFVAYQEAQKGMRACADMRLEQNSTPYYIPDYNLCSMDNFTYHECESHCLNDCEHVKLTFMTDVVDPIVYQNKLPFKYPNSSTLLLIKCGSFSYPQIEEVLAKSFESFMAEFGGLIGLWLGGSLIAFTHIFIFFGRMVHQWLERFKQRKADDL